MNDELSTRALSLLFRLVLGVTFLGLGFNLGLRGLGFKALGRFGALVISGSC